ncbi:FixH family protein [Comamonas aquatica]|nr:FixH family protein [Comamonas aquatica]ANY62059.1 nitrogen fixation protein FixH [Comamonas aquatica]MDH0201788.1 FixH family protein [Comamonas aquatica]MDH0381108.1 FixH family protein [Comamonas aquatica]MDH0428952.1 FixH family protein [Comamonas aquatica]MDH0897942.1 FixH family protein [Comamonas aquatica]
MSQAEMKPEVSTAPWWKFGHVWLVLAGPAIVVVAGIATLVIATRGADPVVDPDYYQKGVNINEQLRNPDKSHAPANAVRNHAATPADDLPNLAPK